MDLEMCWLSIFANAFAIYEANVLISVTNFKEAIFFLVGGESESFRLQFEVLSHVMT